MLRLVLIAAKFRRGTTHWELARVYQDPALWCSWRRVDTVGLAFSFSFSWPGCVDCALPSRWVRFELALTLASCVLTAAVWRLVG